MINRHLNLLQYKENSKEAVNILHTKGFEFLSENFLWQILIYELDHCDIPTEVIHHNLSVSEIVSHIKRYFTSNGIPLAEVNLSGSISPNNTDVLEKAKIKFKGEIWIVHKNDKDTFPSNPHAHNYEKQLKLHLGNGYLFRKKENKGRIATRDFIALRDLLKSKIKGISLPVLEIL